MCEIMKRISSSSSGGASKCSVLMGMPSAKGLYLVADANAVYVAVNGPPDGIGYNAPHPDARPTGVAASGSCGARHGRKWRNWQTRWT